MRSKVQLKDAPTDAARKKPHPSQEWICLHRERLPKPGSKWRHYKGRVVTVLGIVVREETGVIAVAYVEEGGEVWDRLLKDWSECVNVGDRTVSRFVEV